MNAKSAVASRRAAFRLIRAVLRKRRPFDEAVDGILSNLEASRDRAFAYALASLTLRRLGQIDAALESCLEKPLSRKQAEVEDLLRLGAAQILYMQTAPYAAVDTAVTMATLSRDGNTRALKGLINGVLRRLVRERESITATLEGLALRNIPEWLRESWIETYGEETTRAIAAQHLEEPPLDLTMRDPETRRQREKTLGAEWMPTGSLRLRGHRGPLEDLPGYREGAWWVQDAAASLPVQLLGATAEEPVIDLCAAPGGKTAQLAAARCRVRAVDKSAARLKRVADNLRRLKLEAELIEADATEWQPDAAVRFVLLDAPCTSTGTIRRHPDVAWLKSPMDVVAMTALQETLLDSAAGMVAPGGILVYCVCSLQPEEGEQRIETFLDRNAGFERFSVTARELKDMPRAIVTAEGAVRTLPCHMAEQGGMDGFYIARLRKKG